jgi:class 3 adenylate cyclase
MQTVGQWLEQLGLSQYAELFFENDVDLEALRLLSESDLEKLGISLGNRKKLLNAIARLDGSALAADATERPAQQQSLRTEAERRQLTVMFCDLADSTALSSQLDPEPLREVIRAYQSTCAESISRFDGHIAQYLGDGILVYFGHPLAHEDDAQRAVRAGLGIVAAMRDLNRRLSERFGISLSVRVGIHTGLVVVGDIGAGQHYEQLALGEAPNVAARLQATAQPDAVVISNATRRLVEGLFNLKAVSANPLKGVSEPVTAYQVLGESAARTRIEAAGAGLTPLVGRNLEVGLLVDRWGKAADGQGQLVVLTGEPGIGKSRLVQALKERIAAESHTRLESRCSPYYEHTPLYPVIDQLPRELGWRYDDSFEGKLDKLEQVCTRANLSEEGIGLLAIMLSLPTERFRLPPMSPERQKQRTLETLLEWVLKLATQQPVLYVVEDLPWVDPTTLELLTLLMTQAPMVRVLVLLTARPTFQSPWPSRSHLTPVTLDRFTRRQAEQMIGRIAGANPCRRRSWSKSS